MVAPCVYEKSTYDEIVEEYLPLYEAGEYYGGGDSESEAAPYKSSMYTMQNYAEDRF